MAELFWEMSQLHCKQCICFKSPSIWGGEKRNLNGNYFSVQWGMCQIIQKVFFWCNFMKMSPSQNKHVNYIARRDLAHILFNTFFIFLLECVCIFAVSCVFLDANVYTQASFFLGCDPLPWAPQLMGGTEPAPRHAFLPLLSLASVVPLNPNSVRVTEEFCSRWARDHRTQSYLFMGASQTHRAHRGPPFDRGAPWKLAPNTRPSFWVSLSPDSRPSPADARRAAKTEVLAFRGKCTFSGRALWLIGGKQSGYSRQMHQMNANKAVRIFKGAYLRKKRSGEVWQEGEVDGMEQIHHR